MILAERGKLRLDEPVGTYLPAFAANGKERVTVADLLLHRGGLVPDDSMDDYADGPAGALGGSSRRRRSGSRGRTSHTATSGTSCWGSWSRRSTASRWTGSREEEVFEPLGMRDTTYNPPESMRAPLRADGEARRPLDARRGPRPALLRLGRRGGPRRRLQHRRRPGPLLPDDPGPAGWTGAGFCPRRPSAR